MEMHRDRLGSTGQGADSEAMKDLRQILASRTAFYAKADEVFDTSGTSLAEAAGALSARLSFPEPVMTEES